MAKRIYQVGEPCDVCGTPTTEGRDGNGYCKPCYIKWKNASKEQQRPAQPVQTQARDFEAEARGKVRHGLICAFIQGKSAKEIAEQMSDFKLKLLMPLENLIMQSTKKTPPAQELPTIDVNEDDFDVNDVPFN
jgi:hypothetical protein